MTTSQMMSARALRISYASYLRLYIPRHVSELTSFRTPKLNKRCIPTRHSITNPYPTNSPSAHRPSGFAHYDPITAIFSVFTALFESPSLEPSHQITGKHPVCMCYSTTGASAPLDNGNMTLRDSASDMRALFTPGIIEAK
jgi:hypothetical protein